jgi:hypothetical protein
MLSRLRKAGGGKQNAMRTPNQINMIKVIGLCNILVLSESTGMSVRLTFELRLLKNIKKVEGKVVPVLIYLSTTS